jgi:nucleoside 2-deoxyribosyltransferase
MAEQVGGDSTDPGDADPSLIFVIASFREEMEPIFEGIEAAAKACELSAKRVKDVLGDYKVTDQLITMIRQAQYVVADLSYERPNVYFELGYARGLGKRVITIARKGTQLHFDVKDWTCIFYDDSRNLEKELIKRFEAERGRGPEVERYGERVAH